MLMSLKEGHSKLKHLEYDKLVTQSYLIYSEIVMVDEIRTIFLFRTRMYQFAGNYRGTNVNRLCPLCGKHPDLQEYLRECYTMGVARGRGGSRNFRWEGITRDFRHFGLIFDKMYVNLGLSLK